MECQGEEEEKLRQKKESCCNPSIQLKVDLEKRNLFDKISFLLIFILFKIQLTKEKEKKNG
jgi:hypothetical protein